MKKITLVIFALVASISTGFSQANIVATVPSTVNGNSGSRAPNGGLLHTVFRAMYNVPAAEMTPVATSTAFTSFGFQLNQGVSTAANGTITIFMQNSSSSTYTNGTTFSTAGMTQVYSGPYTLPVGSAAANVDLTLPVAFPYTGGAINIAYDYTAAVTSASIANYACFTASPAINGATGSSSVTTTAPVLGNASFRPIFRLGSANTLTNEIIVVTNNAPGKYPTTFGAPEVITADIKNGSNITLTNISVGLNVTGVNTFTNAQIIASLAAGAVTTVTFAAMTTTVLGINTIVVGVLPDQNNSNNNLTVTQSITCDFYAINPPTGTYTAGIGFGINSGILSTPFKTPNASTCIAVRIGISSDANSLGNAASGVILNAAGAIMAQTNTVTISPAMLNNSVVFILTAPLPLAAGTQYYAGYAQPANATGYYPVASTPASAAQMLYASSLAGGPVTLQTANLGYLLIEPAFTSTCGSVGVASQVANAPVVSIFPNPTVNGKTTIVGLEGINTITVFNMLGQSVMTLTSSNEEVSIDLVSQPVGNYLVKVTNSNNLTKTVKIINQ